MRNLILQEFVSVDGMAAGPDNSVDFIPAVSWGDQSFGRRQSAFLDSIDATLLGRVTYEMFAGYWPKSGVRRRNTAADETSPRFGTTFVIRSTSR